MTETTTTVITNGTSVAVKTIAGRPHDTVVLGSLKTVTWIKTNPVLSDGYAITKTQVDKARQYRIIEAIFTIVLVQISVVLTLVEAVPWPGVVVRLVHRVDEFTERTLESIYRTLEWWFDCISIRLMRLLETLVIYLDKFITTIDSVIHWFLQKYDWVFAFVLKVYARVSAVWTWYVSLWTSAWSALRSGVQSTQQMWMLSQESPKKQ